MVSKKLKSYLKLGHLSPIDRRTWYDSDGHLSRFNSCKCGPRMLSMEHSSTLRQSMVTLLTALSLDAMQRTSSPLGENALNQIQLERGTVIVIRKANRAYREIERGKSDKRLRDEGAKGWGNACHSAKCI